MRLRVFLACVLLPLGLWSALPVISHGEPTGSISSIQKKIEKTRSKIGKKKGIERQLSGEIRGISTRIGRLEAKIDGLRVKQTRLQTDLDIKRAELAQLQEKLRAERRRLARLKLRLSTARRLLSRRMVELYQADKPDLVTVVLNSNGFADLLERGEFLDRIKEQDERIVRTVKAAKADAIATAQRLDKLERRQQKVTAIVLSRRNEINDVKQELIDTQVGYKGTRYGKTLALVKNRATRKQLENHLDGLEKESAKIAAQLNGGPAILPAGPIKRGSGRLINPTNGTFTSPFGPRWGRLHAGIDIAAPIGTPIRAADGGRVVLMGPTGGYGNYTCVQHTAAMATCYAHQSAFRTSVGANVGQGQTIGLVGNTGNSTGPHLHFEVRINGNPVDPMGYL